jgi:hypothetical protein
MPDHIDDIFAQSSAHTQEAARAAASRARAAILADLRPVHPIPSSRVFTTALLAVSLLFAIASASLLGLDGLRALAPMQRLLIYSLLLLITWFAAFACSRAMRPASGWSLGPWTLALASLAFPALFALIFRGYTLAHFVHEGIPCLRAGLLIAAPTALVVTWILRRGFVMEWTTTGITAGVLAGLAGLGMLELHCPNRKAIHVIVWHVAVVVCSGLLGWIAGKIADTMRTR